MEKNFKTVNEKATFEIVEKKSRFIANVMPVSSEKDAIDFISMIKKQFYDSRHNCFAYIIKRDIPIIRFSDDGEPNGTAGKPILDVLLGEKLENVVMVVTRYFGGTLLGTGGLVRAYGKVAKECILSAKIIEINSYNKVTIVSDYFISGKIQYELTKNNHIIIDTKYSNVVTFEIYVKSELVDEFEKNIINLTNNSIKIHKNKVSEFLKIVDGKIIIN